MVHSSEGTSAKHKIPEFLFKEKSWTLHQRCTFQSSRNLPTALPAQQGRFRQHQTQPMWDASSQSQTTLPWDWSSRERSRVEKHLGLLCTSEWVSAAQGREEKGEETTPPGSHYVSTGTSQGSLLSSPLSWEQGSGIGWKGGIYPKWLESVPFVVWDLVTLLGNVLSIITCASSPDKKFPVLVKNHLVWQALKEFVRQFFMRLPCKQFCFHQCVVWNKSTD